MQSGMTIGAGDKLRKHTTQTLMREKEGKEGKKEGRDHRTEETKLKKPWDSTKN